MAIIGYLDNIIKTGKFSARLTTSLKYLAGLKAKDFSCLKYGEKCQYAIDGKKVFAINQVYMTRSRETAKFESHRKYIDLQYIFDGEETIFIGSINDGRVVIPYDNEKDIEFYNLKYFSCLNLKKGMVAIFFPEDVHAPSLNVSASIKVKKTVVKVATK